MANSKGHGAAGFSAAARAEQAQQLTVKEQRFVEEYLIDTNQSEAARRAGYSAVSAPQIATQLMKKSKIRAAIATHMDARSNETKVDAAFLLTHLAQMLHADYGDIVDADSGEYKPLHQWPKIWRQMLTGADIEELFEYDKEAKERVNTGRVKKIKFVDRMRVIELLGRHIDIAAFQQPTESHLHQHQHTHVFSQMSPSELRAKNAELDKRIEEQLARLPPHVLEGEVVKRSK